MPVYDAMAKPGYKINIRDIYSLFKKRLAVHHVHRR